MLEGGAEPLFRRTKLALVAHAVADVAQVGNEATDARLVEEVRHRDVEPHPLARRVPEAHLCACSLPGVVADGDESVTDEADVVEMGEIESARSDDVDGPVAEHPLEGGAHVRDRCVTDHHDDVGCVLHERLEARLAHSHVPLSVLLLGGGPSECPDRERDSERRQHGEAVYERLIDQRGRDAGSDRCLTQRDCQN